MLPNSNTTYKNILFDLGNVLFCIDENATSLALSQMMDKSKCSGNWKNSFLLPHIEKYEIGQISTELFINGLLRYALPHVHALDIVLAWNKMLLDLHPKAISMLEQLKPSYRLFLFSNINDLHYKGFRRIIAPKINPDTFESFFEKCYYSHLINRNKPNPEHFQFVIENAQINPAETLFVDDKLENVKGAIQAGLNGLHMHTPCEYEILLHTLQIPQQ